MKEQLENYVDLLFAGAPHASEIKQEILQNTLDRYDDLISQGKQPQAAYQLAIAGIGDISEILLPEAGESAPLDTAVQETQNRNTKPLWKKALQAIGICLYIMCPIPLFVLQNALGLCGLLVFVAIATAMMVISAGKERKQDDPSTSETQESELRKAVRSIVWTVGLCTYFIVSFITQAWFITWIIFPLIGAVEGLLIACMDLKEGK